MSERSVVESEITHTEEAPINERQGQIDAMIKKIRNGECHFLGHFSEGIDVAEELVLDGWQRDYRGYDGDGEIFMSPLIQITSSNGETSLVEIESRQGVWVPNEVHAWKMAS